MNYLELRNFAREFCLSNNYRFTSSTIIFERVYEDNSTNTLKFALKK